MNYYWYITLNPANPSVGNFIDTDNYVRRNITKPPSGFFYVTEVINGYNHSISDSKSIIPPVVTNDQGIPNVIRDIERSIKSRLGSQWEIDNSLSKERLRRSKIPINQEEENDYSDRYSHRFNPLTALLESQEFRKKSSGVKKIKRSIKPCKCKPKRRSK